LGATGSDCGWKKYSHRKQLKNQPKMSSEAADNYLDEKAMEMKSIGLEDPKPEESLDRIAKNVQGYEAPGLGPKQDENDSLSSANLWKGALCGELLFI
jgi:hypothetical protein